MQSHPPPEDGLLWLKRVQKPSSKRIGQKLFMVAKAINTPQISISKPIDEKQPGSFLLSMLIKPAPN